MTRCAYDVRCARDVQIGDSLHHPLREELLLTFVLSGNVADVQGHGGHREEKNQSTIEMPRAF